MRMSSTGSLSAFPWLPSCWSATCRMTTYYYAVCGAVNAPHRSDYWRVGKQPIHTSRPGSHEDTCERYRRRRLPRDRVLRERLGEAVPGDGCVRRAADLP